MSAEDELAALEAEIDAEDLHAANAHAHTDGDDQWTDPTANIDFAHIHKITAHYTADANDSDDFDMKSLGFEPTNDADIDDDLRALQADIDRESQSMHTDGHTHADIDSVDDDLAALDREDADDSEASKKQRSEVQSRLSIEPRRPLSSSSSSSSPPSSFQPQPSSQSQPSLSEQLDALKRRAVSLKQAGKTKDALEVMKNVKALEARIAQQKQQQSQAVKPPVPPKPQSPPPLPPSQSSSQSQSATQESLRAQLQSRILEYQRAAVSSKQAGKLDEAKLFMKIILDCKSKLANDSNAIEPSDIPAPISDASTNNSNERERNETMQSLSSSSSASPSPPPRQPRPPTKSALITKHALQYDTLFKALRKQIIELDTQMTALLSLAAQSGTNASNDVASKANKLLALQYHRLKKRSQHDYDLVEAAHNRQLPPPSYSYSDETLQAIHENANIDDSQLVCEVQALKLYHGDSSNYYVSVRMENENSGSNGVSYSTSNIRGTDSQFASNNRFVFVIGSRTKATIRTVARSKMIFTLYRARMILGSVELARGEVRLKELLDVSDKTETIKLKTGSNGERAGELTVSVKLRRPLAKIDIRQNTRQIIRVDEFDDGSDVTVATAHAGRPAQSESKPTVTTSTGKHTAGNNDSEMIDASVLPPLPSGVTEADLSEPHSILNQYSNDVLEWEIATHIPQSLAAAKRANDSAAIDDWSTRLTSAQTQLTLLVTAVQKGQITLDGYLQQLRDSISHSMLVARALVQRDRKDDARVVMQRMQIMKSELKLAEENRDQLEEE